MNIKEIRENLKSLAVKIRAKKLSFKDYQRGNHSDWTQWAGLGKHQYDFRHIHIASCMFRGRKYEQIEQTVREGNEPNMDHVNEIIEEIRKSYEEVICDCA